jgi:hypothetical protein
MLDSQDESLMGFVQQSLLARTVGLEKMSGD